MPRYPPLRLREGAERVRASVNLIDESEIVDPCWPSPDRNEVACPDVPWSRDVVLLNPVTVPPRGELEEGYTERPWGLELIVDGVEGRIRCVALSSWAGGRCKERGAITGAPPQTASTAVSHTGDPTNRPQPGPSSMRQRTVRSLRLPPSPRPGSKFRLNDARALTDAWTRAEASKPAGWRLMGVVRGPREVDPVIRSESWLAWAVGPNGERAEGTGSYPEQA